MPFAPPRDDGNGKTPQGRYPNDPPLLRLGALYASKSGKAIMGNVHVADPRRGRDGVPESDLPFGDVLIDMIRQCMEEKRPLRFLVFETKMGKAPYSLNLTIGNIMDRTAQPAPKAQQGGPWVPHVPLPNDEEGGDDEPEPEPVPRPVRRTAPRR